MISPILPAEFQLSEKSFSVAGVEDEKVGMCSLWLHL